MLTATVDFNAVEHGLVRGLQEDVVGDDELRTGALILLRDGEGNEAFGTLHEIRDSVLYADVEWETWGPEGTTQMQTIPTPERGSESIIIVTGSVWQAGTSGEVAGRVEKLAERTLLPA